MKGIINGICSMSVGRKVKCKPVIYAKGERGLRALPGKSTESEARNRLITES